MGDGRSTVSAADGPAAASLGGAAAAAGDEAAAEASRLADHLRRYEWLWRCWFTNFCLDRYWETRIPAEWRTALLDLQDAELQRLASDFEAPEGWPPDLKELVRASQRIAPPADLAQRRPPRVSPWLIGGIPHANNMGPKKEHEVLRLAPVVAREARRCGALTVVDLGSGHGYLSHVLAFHYGLHVIGLEAAAHNVVAAHQRAWMVREKLKDPKFHVSDPNQPQLQRTKLAGIAAAAAAGGGDASVAAAEAAARAAASLSATREAAKAAAARGDPSPLVVANGGSFSNLVVRRHARARARAHTHAHDPHDPLVLSSTLTSIAIPPPL